MKSEPWLYIHWTRWVNEQLAPFWRLCDRQGKFRQGQEGATTQVWWEPTPACCSLFATATLSLSPPLSSPLLLHSEHLEELLHDNLHLWFDLSRKAEPECTWHLLLCKGNKCGKDTMRCVGGSAQLIIKVYIASSSTFYLTIKPLYFYGFLSIP